MVLLKIENSKKKCENLCFFLENFLLTNYLKHKQTVSSKKYPIKCANLCISLEIFLLTNSLKHKHTVSSKKYPINGYKAFIYGVST